MPLVNRLLDVFFRTLDAVDMARERVDRVLGRAPRPEPWTTDWSPTPDAPVTLQQSPSSHAHTPNVVAQAPVSSKKSVPGKSAPAKSSPPKSPAAKSSPASRPARAAKKKGGPTKKASGGNRKGSVDRSGKDFDSPRAKAIVEKLKEKSEGVVTDDSAYEGKRVLARVLWALDAADRAGSELGLTAADASALLHLAGGMEVFATNVARACRDEDALIAESAPDGRSKRYKLTDQGREAAAKISTRAISSG